MNTSIPRWLGPSLVAMTAVGIVLALLFGVPTSVNAEDRPIAVTHATVTHSTPAVMRDDYTVTVIPYEAPSGPVGHPVLPPRVKTPPSTVVVPYEGTLGPIPWGTLPGSRS